MPSQRRLVLRTSREIHVPRARLAAVLCALAVVTVALAGCGSDRTDKAPAGNIAAGTFDPPPIQTDVPGPVRKACDVSSRNIDRIKRDGALFWAIGVTPPFGFRVANGEWAGVEAQNAAELATVLGVRAEITEYSYDLLPTAVTTGQADIVGAQLFVTKERKELIDFSTPYYRAGQLFYVLASSPYHRIEDLNRPGVRFVYGFGTAQRLLAEKYLPKATITDAPLRGQLLLHKQLADRSADATMTDAAAMGVVFAEYAKPGLAAIGMDGRITGARAAAKDVIDPFDVAFGLPKGDEGWRGCVNAWVRDLIDSGRLDERLDYWLTQGVP
ncbi:MAG: transporter substrate-binding protein [Marmoricola sp.]|nr:transporter substrate-binding protein [Marmoricola sp.]